MQVTLYTDSNYLRDGITKWLPNWKARGWKTADKKPVKNVDLWQRLEARRRRTKSSGNGSAAMPAIPKTSAPTRWRGRQSRGCAAEAERTHLPAMKGRDLSAALYRPTA